MAIVAPKTLMLFAWAAIGLGACATQNAKAKNDCFDMQSVSVMKQLWELNNQEICLTGIAKFDHKNVSLYAVEAETDNIPYGGKITTDLRAKEFIHSGLDFEQPLTLTGTINLERTVEDCDTNACFTGQLSQSAAENK